MMVLGIIVPVRSLAGQPFALVEDTSQVAKTMELVIERVWIKHKTDALLIAYQKKQGKYPVTVKALWLEAEMDRFQGSRQPL